MRFGCWSKLRAATAVAALGAVLVYAGALEPFGGSSLGSAWAQEQGNVPGGALGNTSDSEYWRAVRQGVQGSVSLPDKKYGLLVQSEGDSWRAVRNGPISVYGGWLLAAVIVVLAVYFAFRGRIRIEAGPAGRTIERFNGIDRFTHWLTAICFLVLGLTGLNLLFGRYVLKPILGPEVFATVTLAGKWAHNFFAFGFMIGVVLIIVLWIRHNIPDRYDLTWLAKGGGLFGKGVHPSARKFNAGQKIVFWLVVLGGILVSLSGISLLFPYEFAMFSKTFAFLDIFGFSLPTDYTPIEEMQLSHIWHTIVALVFIAFIIAHIYIGSLGMEGAFDAMGTGQVDENWAREHHAIWVAELQGEPLAEAGAHDGDD